MRSKKYASHGPTTFLKNTYEILNNESLNSIIRWTEDGSSFIISDIYNFTNSVLPTFFKHKNLSSFIRQLNMYGFRKEKEDDSQTLEFTHSLFHRDKKELLKDIHRKSSETLGSLKKGEIQDLAVRLKKFQSQQVTMETMLENLETQYSQVLEQNQFLISELFQSKQREKQIELFLQNFTQQAKEEVQNMVIEDRSSLMLDIEPFYENSNENEEKWDNIDNYSNE